MNNIDFIRAKAEAATPGPWEADYSEENNYSIKAPGTEWGDGYAWVSDPDNAAFIAAVNPSVMIELMEELERLRLEVASGEMMLRQYADRHPNDLLSKIIKGDAQ